MKKKVEHKCRVCRKIFLYKSKLVRYQSFHEKSELQQCTKCKNVVEEKISSLSIFTCQVFDCEEDSFVPSFTFTDVNDNEIDFMSKYFLNQITMRYRMN